MGEQVVEFREIDIAFSGFDLAPVKAEMRAGARQPLEVLVLVGEPMKGLPAHPRICQEFLGYARFYADGAVGLSSRRQRRERH